MVYLYRLPYVRFIEQVCKFLYILILSVFTSSAVYGLPSALTISNSSSDSYATVPYATQLGIYGANIHLNSSIPTISPFIQSPPSSTYSIVLTLLMVV